MNRPSSPYEEALVFLFTSCVPECRLPQFCNIHNGPDVKRLKANISAYCDTRVDIAFMKGNIESLLRLDLEQTAAVVISAITNDDGIAKRSELVRSLLNEIHPAVLSYSCMRFEYSHTNSAEAIQTRKFSHLVTQTRQVVQDKHLVEMGDNDD